MLGVHVPVIACMTRDKPRYAAPGHVLVDDRLKTREVWEAAGGDFVHHVNAAPSIAALERLGF